MVLSESVLLLFDITLLREKCPKTELFLKYFWVISEVTPFLDTFHAVFILTFNLKKEKQCKKNVLVYYGNDFLSNNWWNTRNERLF